MCHAILRVNDGQTLRSRDFLGNAGSEPLHELKKKSQPATPFLEHGTPVNHAMTKLKEFFQPQPLLTTPTKNPTTNAPSPRVPSTPDSEKRPRNLFGAPKHIPRGINKNAMLEQRTRSQLSQPALFSNGFAKATALLAQKETIDTQMAIHHGMAVTHHQTGKQMECRHLIKDPHCKEAWLHSCANESGSLAQGVGDRVKGTNAIFFIHKHQAPPNKRVTCPRIVCTIRPEKDEPNRTRITVCGNFITDCPGIVTAETADIETIKLHWNHILSTRKGKHMTIDIENMHLNTPLDQHECMKMPLKDIPQEIIDQHQLQTKVASDGCVHIEIRRAMCGSRQSGKLANNQLKENLAKHGHHPAPHTPGLFLHETCPMSFTLVADDFGVGCENKDDAEHLVASLMHHHPIKTDWSGSRCVGIDLDWNHNDRTLKTSMKNHVKRALLQFQHPKPTKSQHSPSPFAPPNCGAKVQLTAIDNSAPLSPKQKLHLQQITGKFPCLARAADDTTMHALNDLATQINTGTQTTMQAATHFSNCCATHPIPPKSTEPVT